MGRLIPGLFDEKAFQRTPYQLELVIKIITILSTFEGNDCNLIIYKKTVQLVEKVNSIDREEEIVYLSIFREAEN